MTSPPSKQPIGSNAPDARSRLRSTFEPLSTTAHPSGWESLWSQDFLPWDKGFPSPALVDLLGSHAELLGSPLLSSNESNEPTGKRDENGKEGRNKDGKRRKKALVPGCGKGYDVLLLAAAGYDAFGLEAAPTALREARAFEELVAKGGLEGEKAEVYRVRDERVGRGSVTWLEGDFFDEASVGGRKFDLIYDYTFLCALHPTLRPTWSARQTHLLTPTGHLICLEFPTYKSPSLGGPPWSLPPVVYECILPRPGREMVYDEQGYIVPGECGEEMAEGLERVEHFQPERTHAIGYDEAGKVTDWIGIWRHRVGK